MVVTVICDGHGTFVREAIGGNGPYETAAVGDCSGCPACLKMLSLWQPWASLCFLVNPETGHPFKSIETRGWSTDYRGPVAVHAALNTKALDYACWQSEHDGETDPIIAPFGARIHAKTTANGRVKAVHDLPLGAVVGVADLVDVVPIVSKLDGFVGDRAVIVGYRG